MKHISLLILFAVLSACSTYSEDDLKGFDEKIQDYLKTEKIECEKSSSGMYFKILEQGEGRKIQFTDRVVFKYKGELLDGTVFDDQREEAVEFDVKDLIGAWKEIMLDLNEGGKAYLVAPPNLGYGTHDLDDIPKNSILVFNMEVVEVK
jgi:FKBP-type peptidyl-prolyl cis-trans isomerase